MGQALSFDLGLREFEVNGGTTIRFNPTDTDFVKRFQATIDRLKELQTEFEGGIEAKSDAVEAALESEDGDAMSAATGELIDHIDGVSDRMRTEIDGLFGEGTAEGVFPGGMSLYALAGGYPVWVNFIEAISDVIVDAFEAEQGKADPRAAASSKKYKDMLAKYKRR